MPQPCQPVVQAHHTCAVQKGHKAPTVHLKAETIGCIHFSPSSTPSGMRKKNSSTRSAREQCFFLLPPCLGHTRFSHSSMLWHTSNLKCELEASKEGCLLALISSGTAGNMAASILPWFTTWCLYAFDFNDSSTIGCHFAIFKMSCARTMLETC